MRVLGRLSLLFASVASVACCADDSRPRAAPAPAASVAPSASAAAPHGIVLPATEGPPTHLVLMLHGVGADAVNFAGLGRALAPALPKADFVVLDGLHPFEGASTGRQWFSVRGITDENRPARVRAAGKEVSDFVDGELARRNLAKDKLVVVGFSQGAMVAAWLMMHRDPRPQALVLLSGRVAEDEAPRGNSGGAAFVTHGEKDTVIAPSAVDPSVRALEAWGIRVTKRTYPALGHQVDDEVVGAARDFLRATVKP